MDTAVINFRTDARLKNAAMKAVEELGLSLSGVLNGFLKELVRSKAISFSVAEEPSEYLIKALKDAEEERKRGETYSFANADDAVAFLDKVIHEN